MQTDLPRQASRIRHTFKQLHLDKQAISHTFVRPVSPSDHYCRPTRNTQDGTDRQPAFFSSHPHTTRYSPYTPSFHTLYRSLTAPALLPMSADSQHTPCRSICRTCGDRISIAPVATEYLSILLFLSKTSLKPAEHTIATQSQATGQNTAQRFPSTANNGVPRKPPLLLFSIFFSLSPIASTVQLLSTLNTDAPLFLVPPLHFRVFILYYDQQMHSYFTNYHTTTCCDTIVSYSGSL
jgi:hypothetical protein